MGLFDFGRKTVTVETPPAPPEPTRENILKAFGPGHEKVLTFSPTDNRLSNLISNDPVYAAIHGSWADHQQHGRLRYDTMMKHAAVAAPLNTLIALLKSYKPLFKPAGENPTENQKQLARFANEQIRRLGSSGDGRQGWERFIDWIGQGLRYGFSMAELGTAFSPWEGQRRIQVERFNPFAQSSLDNGITPLEDYGQRIIDYDVRYKCFEMSPSGRIIRLRQFYSKTGGDETKELSWQGNELLRILHFVHNGGEGNPFGESILFAAFYAWADLYSIEAMETAFLDGSLPWLGISYKTPDGRPSPALHAQVIETLKQQDASVRALVMPDTTFSSVAPSNPAATEHFSAKKKELRAYIHACILGANLAGDAASATEIDTRNATQVFFKYLLPALQREISTLLTWQFARRLIDANWSGLSESDYPEVEFRNILDNDLRVSLPLIQQFLPFVDSSRLGELAESLVPGFDREWIAQNHAQSVAMQRQTPDPAAQSGVRPPPKQSGTPDNPAPGQTQSVGQVVGVDN